jgi:tetratricopeptide (TPR) repeat protein
MKYLSLFIIVVLLGCAPRLEINEKPMYGRQVKCDALKKADSIFIATCLTQIPTKDSASKIVASRGFDYFKKGYISTAMKRFNQAWLLDSTNSHAYWGMAMIVSNRDKNYLKAAELMEIGIKYSHDDYEFFFDYAVSNMDVIQKVTLDSTQSSIFRDKALNAFNKVIELCPHIDKRWKLANKFKNDLTYGYISPQDARK